jgi:hypothetical protein
VTSEIATYRRLRAAIVAAREQSAVTMLAGSTELNLPDAATYAGNHMRLEGLHGIRIVQRVGVLEIGPERRANSERRSGYDRRSNARDGHVWADRRANSDRRAGRDRRASLTQVWETST